MKCTSSLNSSEWVGVTQNEIFQQTCEHCCQQIRTKPPPPPPPPPDSGGEKTFSASFMPTCKQMKKAFLVVSQAWVLDREYKLRIKVFPWNLKTYGLHFQIKLNDQLKAYRTWPSWAPCTKPAMSVTWRNAGTLLVRETKKEGKEYWSCCFSDNYM